MRWWWRRSMTLTTAMRRRRREPREGPIVAVTTVLALRCCAAAASRPVRHKGARDERDEEQLQEASASLLTATTALHLFETDDEINVMGIDARLLVVAAVGWQLRCR